jgi:hypothetical protein
MSTLFELSFKFRDLLEMAEHDQDDEPLQDAIMSTLESVEYEVKDKIVDCAKYIKNLQAQSDAIKQATDDMLKRKTAMDKRIENVKRYVLQNMQATQIKNVECEFFKVSVKNNPPSVQILDDSKIPAEFINTKQVISIDKTAIKQAGGCEGAIVVQNQSLMIK